MNCYRLLVSIVTIRRIPPDQDCSSGEQCRQAGPRKPANARLPFHHLLEESGIIPTL